MTSTGEKITALSARTSTQVAATDVFVFVDVSDTSMAASGTDRKMTALEVGRTAVAQAGGTPAVTLGTAGAAGTANSLMRTDATLAVFDATVPVTQAIGDAAAAGSATRAARRDHKHAMPSFAAPTVALSSAAGAGAAATLIRSDATIAAFSTGTPATQAVGDAAAKGSVNFAARLDHKHAMPAFASPTVALSSAAASGSAATLIRSDATIHAFSTVAPVTQAMGDAAAKGSAAFAARADHKHAMPAFGTPTVTFTTAQGAGTASTPLRSDAVLKVFSTATPQTQAMGDAASKGTAAFAARIDHKHAMPSFATPTVTFTTAQGAGTASTPLRSDAVFKVFSTSAPATQAVGDAAAKGSAAFAARIDHKHAWPSAASFMASLSGASTVNFSFNNKSVTHVGAVGSRVYRSTASSTALALDLSSYSVFDVTMSANCVFTFTNPSTADSTIFTLILRSTHTATLPATVKWGDASAPTYATPSQYVFTKVPASSLYFGQQVAKAFG